MPILSVGRSAPAFTLSGIDGNSHTLNEDGARLTLAVFFKTTCPTCALAFPYLEKLYQAYRAAGLVVWGISQSDRDASAAFAAAHGSHFPILLDAGLHVSRTFDPEFVPTTLLVDPAGSIVDVLVGFNKARLNDLSETLAARLDAPAAMIAPDNDGAPVFRPG